MIHDIDPTLARLAEPAPPPALAATVMARIAREPEGRPARVPVRRPVRARERSGWLSAAAGLLLIVGLVVQGWHSTGSAPDVLSSRVGIGRGVLLPLDAGGVLLAGLGVCLFLVGLLAPLRRLHPRR